MVHLWIIKNSYPVENATKHFTIYPQSSDKIESLENLNEILEIASILAADFLFVRVDIYDFEGRIFFGEMTFYPEAGTGKFTLRSLRKGQAICLYYH